LFYHRKCELVTRLDDIFCVIDHCFAIVAGDSTVEHAIAGQRITLDYPGALGIFSGCTNSAQIIGNIRSILFQDDEG